MAGTIEHRRAGVQLHDGAYRDAPLHGSVARNDLADIEDDDLHAERKVEIDELLNRSKTSGKADETEKPKITDIDLSLPDPTVSVADRNDYGYVYDGMLPMTAARVIELFDTGHPIYLLYPDNTEALVWERDEIITFSSDGFCGITADDWEISPVRAAQLNVAARTTGNRNCSPPLRECSASTKSNRQDRPVRNGIEEARNFRFASMKELEAHGLTP